MCTSQNNRLNPKMWCGEKSTSSRMGFFSPARMAASITRLVRHCFVRTQEEFQQSKYSFLLSSCERLAAFSQYISHQQHTIIKSTLEEGQEKTPLHQGYSMISNSTQAHNGGSKCQPFSKVMELQILFIVVLELQIFTHVI